MGDFKFMKKRKGKERKERARKGKEGQGKERKGKEERKGKTIFITGNKGH